MWGFTTQMVDRMADSASVATVGPAVGTASNDRDDPAALGLSQPARAVCDGPFSSRDVRPGADPGSAARDSEAVRSPMG
jgi:hypothetical protein